MQSCRSIHQGNGVLCPEKLCEASLKLEDSRPHSTLVCEHSAAENVNYRVNLFLSEKWLIDSNEFSQFLVGKLLVSSSTFVQAKRVRTTELENTNLLRMLNEKLLHRISMIGSGQPRRDVTLSSI